MSSHSTHIPLFPLPTVVLPGGLLPLRLFELRYIDMVKDCFKNGSGFGVCLAKPSGDGQVEEPYPHGTLVSLIDFDQGADGLLHIVAEGTQEFQLNQYSIEPSGLVVGDVSFLPIAEPQSLPERYASLGSKLGVILDYVEQHISYPDRQLNDAAWVCHRLLELLPLDAPVKFDILNLIDLDDRLEAIEALKFSIESE